MRMKKLAAVIAAMAVSASMLSVSAFADIDYMAEAEANKGLSFTGSAGWAGGQWIVGNDNKAMENPLTIADLEAADHFEIGYTSTEAPPTADGGSGAKLTFCYKFVTAVDEKGEDSVMEAYLPEGWYQYGPSGETGNSYHVIDIFAWDVQSEGTLIVPTSVILDSIQVDKDTILYMRQFGIGCNTYDYDEEWVEESDFGADYDVTITSVKLCDSSDEQSEAAMNDIADEETPEATDAVVSDEPSEDTASADTEATADEEPAEATPADTEAPADEAPAETTAAPAEPDVYDGFPIWGFIAIGAGVLLIVVVVIVTVSKKKK